VESQKSPSKLRTHTVSNMHTPNKMSDAVALDLFIQDFVKTNKLLNSGIPWATLVSRRHADDGVRRVYEFQSEGSVHYAVGQLLHLPDSDWYRIELWRPIPIVDEHRFDCLQMMQQTTHTTLQVDHEDSNILVKLTTRNRGLVNMVFVIHGSGAGPRSPFTA
jgi:hypothetical protein